ncbi:primase-helicase family protein [Endozoicomonas sp.]|uniref:primase-helicase family protein n=1 Tax=Endozoicomonas sp. TaxID=1892382 RepID=UPI002883EA8C|nr:DUF5906 domain-containing protein [Endozoicomonas sp.]
MLEKESSVPDSDDTSVTESRQENATENTRTSAKNAVKAPKKQNGKADSKKAKKTIGKDKATKSRNVTSQATYHDNVIPLSSDGSPDFSQHINQCIEELNRNYYHIIINGKNRIMRMISADVGTGLQPEFFTAEEFKAKWSHEQKIPVGYRGGQITRKSKGDVWLNHADANFVDGSLDFDPSKPPLTVTPRNRLNIWQGFGVKPAGIPPSELLNDEQVAQYLVHIRDVICAGDERDYRYLVEYLAHMVQKPWEKPSVAIVLKAGQGVGKGTFMAPLITIIGGHALATTQSKDVTGKFNAALESKVLVFFDEAFAGSKQASDMLKGLISELYTRIERKGIDSIRVPNKMRIFMASNSENIVVVESDDRRYFFLSVSEHVKQDKAYFSERAYMQQSHPDHHQFVEKLLQYLLNISIEDFDPHHAPVTSELVKQKIDSLKPEERWVYNILVNDGIVAGAWPAWMDNQECYQACENWIDQRKMKPLYGNPATAIGRALNKAGIESKMHRTGVGDKPERVRVFPSLDQARQTFERFLKGSIDWE